MFNLFKRKKTYPPFERLLSYDKADFYFIRTARWFWLDKKNITVVDPLGPRMLTLDPWPQLVFLDADGSKTVNDYIYFMASQYDGQIPVELDKQIIDELESLIRYGIIKLSELKQRPEHLYDKPDSSPG